MFPNPNLPGKKTNKISYFEKEWDPSLCSIHFEITSNYNQMSVFTIYNYSFNMNTIYRNQNTIHV